MSRRWNISITFSHAGIEAASLRLLYQQHGDRIHGLTAGGDDALALWEKLCNLVP
jgi:hypothetical protein